MSKAIIFDGENEISVIPSDITKENVVKNLVSTMIYRDTLKTAMNTAKTTNQSQLQIVMLSDKYTEITRGFGFIYGKLLDLHGETRALEIIAEVDLLIKLEEEEFKSNH